jgi:hypothetical protein
LKPDHQCSHHVLLPLDESLRGVWHVDAKRRGLAQSETMSLPEKVVNAFVPNLEE